MQRVLVLFSGCAEGTRSGDRKCGPSGQPLNGPFRIHLCFWDARAYARAMSDVSMQPISGPFQATFTPPGSKSLTNRALVLAALADGHCVLSNVLFADDTRVMLDGLAKLGFELEIDEPANAVTVHGRAGEVPNE